MEGVREWREGDRQAGRAGPGRMMMGAGGAWRYLEAVWVARVSRNDAIVC